MAKKIFISCGELSGDMHAAALVRALRALKPDLEFVAIGGPNLREAGARLLADSTTWGTIGFFEGLARFPRTYPVLRRIGRLFAAERPDIFLPVDYRVFNMRAARAARDRGIPVVYYFSPVSWFGAGGGRFAQLAQCVDLAIATFPISLDAYAAAGVPHVYVGHPLIDIVRPERPREEAAHEFGVDPSRPIIGLMPGSRFQEVSRLLPVFMKVLSLISAARPDAQFLLFRAHDALARMIDKYVSGAPVRVLDKGRYDFMALADVLVLCSGTATHEAMLLDTPMVVCYRLSAATAWLARRLMTAPPMIALPNILAGDFIVPECVQEECAPERIAAETVKLLEDSAARDTMKAALRVEAARLGKPGVLDHAARIVLDALDGRWPEEKNNHGNTETQRKQ